MRKIAVARFADFEQFLKWNGGLLRINPPYALVAFVVAVLLMLAGPSPASAQKYAQLLPGEGRYASFTYVRYGSEHEGFFNRSDASSAVQILNRLANAQKNCNQNAWDQAYTNFREILQVAYEQTQRAAENRYQFNEADDDYKALGRLFTNIPPWQPCTQKTQAQPPRAAPPSTPIPAPRFPRPRLWKIPVTPLPSRFCSQEEKKDYIEFADDEAKRALEQSNALIQYDKLMIQTLSRLTAANPNFSPEIAKNIQDEESWALNWAEEYRKLSNQLHSLALAASQMPVENCGKTSYMGVPQIKLGGELAWGGSRNGFEDSDFNGSGIVGGVSGQFNFAIGAGIYAGLGASVLGSSVSGSAPDPLTSNIRLLVPIDGIVGATFMPSGWQWPVSIYGFGGLAIGDVNINAPPFAATQTMTGWSIGVGGEVQISPTWSVGLKYRHFDLGNANFSVFPGGTSFVTERGDMVTGTLTYHFPLAAPAPAAPLVTK